MSIHRSADVGSEGASPQQPSPRLPAWLGIIFVGLFLLGFGLVSIGAPGGTLGKDLLVQFYQNGTNRLLIIFGVYLIPFAGIAFMWFMVSLRAWMIHSDGKEDTMLSSMQLGSALIFVLLFFCAGAAGSAVAVSVQFLGASVPGSETASLLPNLGYTLLFVYSIRGAAMFTVVTSRIGHSKKLFPLWLSITGYLVGLFLLLSVSFSKLLVLVFPVWILLVCTFLFYKANTLSISSN